MTCASIGHGRSRSCGLKSTWALAVRTAPRHGEVVNENIAQWVAVVVGVASIALYSGLMIATDGTSGWSWILLVAGIGSLIGGARLFRRNAAP